jgi:hypothetical protein
MYSFSERLAAVRELGLVNVRVVETEGKGFKSALLSLPQVDVKNDAGLLMIIDSQRQVSFALILSMRRDNCVHAVWTEGAARTIRTLGDQTPDEDVATFTKRIPTSLTNSGEYATKNNAYDNNGVWFISVAGGKLRMWEVAVVTDISDGYSHYFLSLQEVYKAGLFGKDGAIWMPPEQFPGYGNWQSLQSYLAGTVDVESLKPASRHKAKAEKLPPLGKNQARVVWFSQSRRYGLAALADGRIARLHASKVLEQEFPAFEPGEIISFEQLKPTPQGYDLLGVKAII